MGPECAEREGPTRGRGREGNRRRPRETAHDAFWSACELVESKPEDVALSAAVPGLLRHVFEADMEQLLRRGKATTNVTCLQPAADAPKTRADDEPGYGVIDDDLLAVPLSEGRSCEGGECCEACF